MTAALTGLKSWANVQVVLTKQPVSPTGENLAPTGLDLKVIRHFPLANVLKAFDAAICAAGYNSVHEELAANIPTVFIPNSRGTDNQAARAAWAADHQMALTVDQSNLGQITQVVSTLADQTVRERLSENCAALEAVTGAKDVAEILDMIIKHDVKENMNVSTPNNMTIDFMAREALEALDARDIRIIYDMSKPNGQYRKDIDTTKFKNIFPNYEFTSYVEGIKQTYNTLYGK
jgi:hypothetical protein